MSTESPNDLQQLEQLRSLTDRMLAASEAGEWQELERLSQQRLQLVAALTLTPASAAQAEQYRRLLESVRQDDLQLQQRSEAQRRQILNQLRSDDQGEKMKAAYGKAKRRF